LAVVAALVALIVSLLLPPTYAATALVAVTEPRYMMNFDPRFETTDIQPAYKAYPELAGSDALQQEVLAQAETLPKGVETLDDLREAVDAESGDDPSLVHLTVEARDPEVAAALANLWAERFAVRANDLYGSANAEQVTFLETQLAGAETTLAEAEQALVDFAVRNDGAILRAKLASAQQDQSDTLAEQREIARLQQDIAGLRRELVDRNPGQVTRGDELAVLQLRARPPSAISTSGQTVVDATGVSEIQIQVGEGETLAGSTVADLVALLDALQAASEQIFQKNETRLDSLEPQILDLQQRLQEMENEGNRLERDPDVTQETYTTLARKVSEARIAVADTGGEVQLASRAAATGRRGKTKESVEYGSRRGIGTDSGGVWGICDRVVAGDQVMNSMGQDVECEKKQGPHI